MAGERQPRIEDIRKPDLVRYHTAALLARIRAKQAPYPVIFADQVLLALPDVWVPRTDAHLLISQLPEDLSGERVLEIGTGTGAVASIAGLRGATGVAVDINPQAVINARLNFARYHIPMQALQSDLFDNIPPGEKPFDQIFVIPPYYEGKPQNDLDHAVVGGEKFIQRFFNGINNYLSPEGKILITYAQWAGEDSLQFLEQTIERHGYQHKIIATKASKTGKLTYRLYEITYATIETTNK